MLLTDICRFSDFITQPIRSIHNFRYLQLQPISSGYPSIWSNQHFPDILTVVTSKTYNHCKDVHKSFQSDKNHHITIWWSKSCKQDQMLAWCTKTEMHVHLLCLFKYFTCSWAIGNKKWQKDSSNQIKCQVITRCIPIPFIVSIKSGQNVNHQLLMTQWYFEQEPDGTFLIFLTSKWRPKTAKTRQDNCIAGASGWCN